MINNKIKEIYLSKYDRESALDTLDKYGVVVLLNYFTEQQAKKWKDDTINWLVDISPELNPNDKKTWKTENLPYGPRTGMMQSIIAHAPSFFEMRESIYPLFKDLWQEEKLLTSLDGASIHPPIYETKSSKDWPHIDLTRTGIKCIQGQIVLSESTAAFRCTPTSYLHHQDILKLCDKTEDKTDWCKFTEPQIEKLKKIFGDKWQLPIYSPPGSVILWYSNTIHSAARNIKGDEGWRSVVYICQRPVDQFTKKEKDRLRNAALSGRTTNHWGTKIFPKRPGFYMQPKKNPVLEELTDNTSQLVIEHTPLMRKLLAIEEWQ